MKNNKFVLAVSLRARLRGLLGSRSRWKPDRILVLAPCRSIHTWWMLYPIDVAFVDKDGVVIFAERNVSPWRVISKQKSRFVLERPYCDDMPWFEKGDMVPFVLYGNF